MHTWTLRMRWHELDPYGHVGLQLARTRSGSRTRPSANVVAVSQHFLRSPDEVTYGQIGHAPAPGRTTTASRQWCPYGRETRLEGSSMASVARVTEISAKSEKSFEDAIHVGLDRATKTLRNVRGAWVKEQQVNLDGQRITDYQVNLQVTFDLDD